MFKKYLILLLFSQGCNTVEEYVEQPDVVSKRAAYREYYSYDNVTGKWFWKDDLKKIQKQRALKTKKIKPVIIKKPIAVKVPSASCTSIKSPVVPVVKSPVIPIQVKVPLKAIDQPTPQNKPIPVKKPTLYERFKNKINHYRLKLKNFME